MAFSLRPPQESNTALAATTKSLQDEKLRLDALLVRQYNLISVLGGSGKKDKKKGGTGGTGGKGGTGDSGTPPDGSTAASREGLTLDRIEVRCTAAW